jgi:hypothetical protein
LRGKKQTPNKEIYLFDRQTPILPSVSDPTPLMKTKLPAVIAGLLVAAAAIAIAAPLMETTAIHSQPDAASPAIGYLKAGTDPIAATDATPPAGWMAIDLPGPHEAYVHNNDFSKSLDVHAGAAIRLKPKADAPILATMQEGDKIEITGLRSGWTQIKLYKTVVGYVRIGGESVADNSLPLPTSTTPAAPAGAPALVAPPANAGPAAPLPHTLQGMVVETKRFLLIGHRADYDYQLNDSTGKRIAFLDVSRVKPLQKMESYVDQLVTVSGAIKPTEDYKNLVVDVQTLEMR